MCAGAHGPALVTNASNGRLMTSTFMLIVSNPKRHHSIQLDLSSVLRRVTEYPQRVLVDSVDTRDTAS